jgi:predicted nucleotide-binding protein (sugar kinase/HSP70/actin superfamily)
MNDFEVITAFKETDERLSDLEEKMNAVLELLLEDGKKKAKK